MSNFTFSPMNEVAQQLTKNLLKLHLNAQTISNDFKRHLASDEPTKVNLLRHCLRRKGDPSSSALILSMIARRKIGRIISGCDQNSSDILDSVLEKIKKRKRGGRTSREPTTSVLLINEGLDTSDEMVTVANDGLRSLAIEKFCDDRAASLYFVLSHHHVAYSDLHEALVQCKQHEICQQILASLRSWYDECIKTHDTWYDETNLQLRTSDKDKNLPLRSSDGNLSLRTPRTAGAIRKRNKVNRSSILFPAERTIQRRHSSASQSPLSPSSAFSTSSIDDEIRKAISENCLDDPTYLVFLFHALGDSVPESLFIQIQSPQLRWSEHGTEQEVTALDAGLDQRLVDILSDESRSKRALDSSAQFTRMNERWVLSLDSQFEKKLSQALTNGRKEEWCLKALSLVCFIFPRQVCWKSPSDSRAAIRSLLPLLNHALQGIKLANMPSSVKDEVSEALLAASKTGNHVRQNVLATLAKLVGDESPLHLRAEMAYQMSISSRLSANFDCSERSIHDFCCRCRDYHDACIPKFYQEFQPARVSSRLNALYGRLHGSHLENLIQCERYDSAIQEVEDWQVPISPSPMEKRVRPSRTVTVCKIFRSQGLFPEARQRLELCLRLLEPQDVNRTQVLCSLADIYCDLRLPNEASMLIAPEIEEESKKATRSKATRRLLVSMIDVDIQRCLYEDARKAIDELDGIIDNLPNMDVSDQLLHVRVLIASAKVYQYDSQSVPAIQGWNIAMAQIQKYDSFKREGFTYAVIHLSLSLAYLETGDYGQAQTSFECAKKILLRGQGDYCIPTLRAWAEDTLSKVQSLTGWSVVLSSDSKSYLK